MPQILNGWNNRGRAGSTLSGIESDMRLPVEFDTRILVIGKFTRGFADHSQLFQIARYNIPANAAATFLHPSAFK